MVGVGVEWGLVRSCSMGKLSGADCNCKLALVISNAAFCKFKARGFVNSPVGGGARSGGSDGCWIV
jgi:hypothetical protein